MNGPQAAQRAGITYRQLDYWLRRGFLGESDSNTPGSGYVRDLTVTQVERLTQLAALVQAGVRPEVAAAWLDEAQDADGVKVIEHGPVRITLAVA